MSVEVEAEIYWVAIDSCNYAGIVKSRLVKEEFSSRFEILSHDDCWLLGLADFCSGWDVAELNGPFDKENAIEFYEAIIARLKRVCTPFYYCIVNRISDLRTKQVWLIIVPPNIYETGNTSRCEGPAFFHTEE